MGRCGWRPGGVQDRRKGMEHASANSSVRSLALERRPGHLLGAGRGIIRLIFPCVAEYGDRLMDRSQDGAGRG